jgi:hypothetical protein
MYKILEDPSVVPTFIFPNENPVSTGCVIKKE